VVRGADAGNWAGEYTDKNFLKGQGVFQLSIEQSGNAIQVSFDAAHNDGSGAAPEGQGPAKVTGKDTLQFNFKDSFNNSGTGTIKRAGDDIILTIKPAHVADARCLVFYGENMRLKRSGKK
jgi:hypothetical protein